MTNDEDLSSLKLRFLWNKPRSILETPPGYANIELLAKLSFIDDRLVCCDMFKDIELLQGYKSGLENQGTFTGGWEVQSYGNIMIIQLV